MIHVVTTMGSISRHVKHAALDLAVLCVDLRSATSVVLPTVAHVISRRPAEARAWLRAYWTQSVIDTMESSTLARTCAAQPHVVIFAVVFLQSRSAIFPIRPSPAAARKMCSEFAAPLSWLLACLILAKGSVELHATKILLIQTCESAAMQIVMACTVLQTVLSHQQGPKVAAVIKSTVRASWKGRLHALLVLTVWPGKSTAVMLVSHRPIQMH